MYKFDCVIFAELPKEECVDWSNLRAECVIFEWF